LGQVLDGPIVGASGTTLSIRAAMVAASALHTGVLALLFRARSQRDANRGFRHIVQEPRP
jgi:hypothetical protein